MNPTPAAGQFKCNLNVQPDFLYEVQTSSNLLLWSHLTTCLATTTATTFVDTNPATTMARFYRVVTQP